MYQVAGKCETKMSIDYPIENACGFVKGLLTLDEKGNPGGRKARTITALISMFVGTTFCLGAYAYFLYQSKYKCIETFVLSHVT